MRTNRFLNKNMWEICSHFFVIFISDRTVWVITKKYIGVDEVSKVSDYFTRHIDPKRVKFAKY